MKTSTNKMLTQAAGLFPSDAVVVDEDGLGDCTSVFTSVDEFHEHLRECCEDWSDDETSAEDIFAANEDKYTPIWDYVLDPKNHRTSCTDLFKSANGCDGLIAAIDSLLQAISDLNDATDN